MRSSLVARVNLSTSILLLAGGWVAPVQAAQEPGVGCGQWDDVFSVDGADGTVLVAATFDDGTGGKLYVGGSFLAVGGVPAQCIARWDGASWQMLGSGMNHSVYALASFDAGAGPELYAGGIFSTAGSAPVVYDRLAGSELGQAHERAVLPDAIVGESSSPIAGR